MEENRGIALRKTVIVEKKAKKKNVLFLLLFVTLLHCWGTDERVYAEMRSLVRCSRRRH